MEFTARNPRKQIKANRDYTDIDDKKFCKSIYWVCQAYTYYVRKCISHVYMVKKTLYYSVCGQSKLKAEINGNRGKRETHSILKRQITSDDNL